jgi:hypothetical protein
MTTNRNPKGETMNTDINTIVRAVLIALKDMQEGDQAQWEEKSPRKRSSRDEHERTGLWWSDDENAVLRVGVELNRTNGEIAAFLGRTKMGVRKQKARVFGS